MKSIKLCILALALAILACAPCPTTPPPAGAEGSAILLKVKQGLDAARGTAATATSPSYRIAVGHVLALDSSSFWCETASLYDELASFEKDAAAGGAPIPPELTEAIALVKWALDHAACNCSPRLARIGSTQGAL